MKRDYELAVIFNPEVSEEETRAVLERLDQIVASHGGQVVKVNQWGRRRLAYPIDRHRDGLYVFIDLILTPETVLELERTLKVSEIVLRYMSRKRDPKAIQKEREEREARAAAAAAAAATAPTSGEPVASVEETEVNNEVPTEGTEDAPAAIEADEFADAPSATDSEETVESK